MEKNGRNIEEFYSNHCYTCSPNTADRNVPVRDVHCGLWLN